ncbi:MAG: hypothetical protein ACOYB8_11245 [Eubacteriaceae bacterium]|jgi:energy-coupling factor transport system substrate-specific component
MKIREIVLLSLCSAILLVVHVAFSFLPNIELVTPLILIYTLVFRKQIFYIIYLYALLTGLIWGFGIWWINYLYVWSVLAIIVLLLKKNESVVVWSVIAALFGLCFGALCAIPYWIAGGWAAAVSYWIAGIPFDLIHCAANFVVTLLIFKPVYSVCTKMYAKTMIC